MSNNNLASVSDAIVEGYRRYSAEKSEKIKKAVVKAGREVKDDVVSNSPVRQTRTPTRSRRAWRTAISPSRQPGAYKSGWTALKKELGQQVTVRVYNKTNYQIAHLLELGHKNRNGTFTHGKAHIKPAEDKGRQELNSEIDRILRE